MRSLEGVMMSNVIKKRNKQGGFSFVELLIALLIVAILVAVVILVTQGFFSKARESALDIDLKDIQTAVGTYAIQSNKWPTANGSLPPSGQYALIDFNANFVNEEGKAMSFYPHFINRLPRHSDEGVWRIDSAALVSIDMASDKY